MTFYELVFLVFTFAWSVGNTVLVWYLAGRVATLEDRR